MREQQLAIIFCIILRSKEIKKGNEDTKGSLLQFSSGIFQIRAGRGTRLAVPLGAYGCPPEYKQWEYTTQNGYLFLMSVRYKPHGQS
jgi:hypothetical protein